MKSWVATACVGCLGCLLCFVTGCGGPHPPLAVVEHVELDRYTGLWYEIARYPNNFQEDCVGVTAEYTLREDGRIDVVNRCHTDRLDGPIRDISGVARVADEETNAKLKVTFFWPFEGDYWIIDLGEDYEWAVVGEPSRKYLWVLSRQPTLEQEIYEGILARLPAKEYDPAKLQLTPQWPTPREER